MATYNQIIYNIRNLYRGGLASDDDTVSDRQILFVFNTHRAFLVQQDKRKGRSYDRQVVQDLGRLEVECVDAAECCEIGLTGSNVLRTKEKLPAFLEIDGTIAITYVGRVDKQEAFQVSSRTQTRWSRFNKFTSKAVKAYIDNNNGYLYIENAPKGLELINVQGVLAEPEKIKDFMDCPGDDCFSFDEKYPINEGMIARVNDLVLQKDMRLLVTTPQDRVNDTKPNEEVQAQRRV